MGQTTTQTIFPLPAGTPIVRGQTYTTRVGTHSLTFQSDGDLVVTTSSGAALWRLSDVCPTYARADSVKVASDGNLVVHDDRGGYLWSALTQNPDSNAQLVLTPDGKLGLVSSGRGVLWSSDGNLANHFYHLQADCQSCRMGLQVLWDNMVRARENTRKAPGDGRRAWKEVWDEFKYNYLPACKRIGAIIEAHRGEPLLAPIEEAMRGHEVAGWNEYFQGRYGISTHGNNVIAYGSYDGGSYEGTDAGRRMRISIGRVRAILDLLEGFEIGPDNGWTYRRTLTKPQITILGSSRVSSTAMNVVAHIYKEMTSRFTPRYPLQNLDGYIIYITNGEPWSELSTLAPIGTRAWNVNAHGVSEGDDLRGGQFEKYIWLSEQMICKRGVRTRNEAHDAGKRDARDDADRTFDQVIHEFGHAIEDQYQLGTRIAQVYTNDPAEAFCWSIQHWFGAPSGTLSANEQTLMREIFRTQTTFSRDLYQPRPT